ncbi:hypothetical protein [Segniliparus sp.]|uniref:hypothetical protein n=1 Tax=Segniliparus sp. TaxID=2804064 RepID=UPI003F6628B9
MDHPGLDTSAKRRLTAAAFAFAAIASLWSSPAAFADDNDDAASDGPSAEALRNARNPYVSGPLAGIGGPSAGGQQDIGKAIGDVLGNDGQGVNLDGVGDLLGGDGQGVNLDGVGKIVGDVLGNAGNGLGAIGSGPVAGNGQSENQLPDAVRNGVRALNRALGDKGANSQDPAAEADDDN